MLGLFVPFGNCRSCNCDRSGDNDLLRNWSKLMAKKLEIGDVFPEMTLNLVGGGTATLPDLGDAKYQVILFYRGHW